MVSFEQELKKYFSDNKITFEDNSSSLNKMDFTIKGLFAKDFHIDAKEKRQKINTKNWPLISDKDEPFTFIIDDLAARKALAYAPRSGMIVRDNLTGSYYWFSILDLFLMPKIRVNRKIRNNILTYKGKWLIDFRNGTKTDTLTDLMKKIKDEDRELLLKFTQNLECYGTYYGEKIVLQGETRNPEHWNIDIKGTR